jgi:AcrR family transcriptional regulator
MAQTKRRRRKDARPEEIITAALLEFREKGYAGSSIAGIAARADIARSTVYLYFDDKEALIRWACEDRIAAVFDAAQEGALSHDVPFEVAFRSLLDGVYARIVQTDALVLLRILIAEGDRFPELTAFYHDTILRRALGLLERMIASGVARGALRPEVAQHDVKLIMAPVMLAGIWRLTFDDLQTIDIARFIDGHVDIVTNGLLAR